MNLKFWQKPTELELATERLKTLTNERQSLEVARQLQYESSRLEALQSQGDPFYESPRATPVQPRTLTVPVPVYETNSCGYPFSPAVRYEQVTLPAGDARFEQDPIFGYAQSPLDPWGGAYNFMNVGLASFPREMFPASMQTLRIQLAQDAARWESRIWWETIPVYNGLLGHLQNYIVGEGMTIDVTSDTDEALAQEVNDFIEEFAQYRYNNLYQRVWDAALGLYRDGESFLRLYPTDDLPLLRWIDPGWVRAEHNDTVGPWGMGILTDWPIDHIEPLAYHVWLPDNTHADVSPTQMFHYKLESSVTGNTKRGAPLSYRMRKQLQQISKLTDCLAVGEAARQAIPYIQSFEVADRTAVQGVISSRTAPPWTMTPTGLRRHGRDIEPGEIQYINAGQKFVEPPEGHADSGQVAYNVLCQVIANACNVPIWFVSASVTEETKANALTAEAPVVRMLIHVQNGLCRHFEAVLKSVVAMGAAQGRFPADVLDNLNICCTLPTPISRDLQQEMAVYSELTNRGCCSPQTLCQRFSLDFDEQRTLIKEAEAAGWQAVPGDQILSERPTGQETEKAAEANG